MSDRLQGEAVSEYVKLVAAGKLSVEEAALLLAEESSGGLTALGARDLIGTTLGQLIPPVAETAPRRAQGAAGRAGGRVPASPRVGLSTSAVGGVATVELSNFVADPESKEPTAAVLSAAAAKYAGDARVFLEVESLASGTYAKLIAPQGHAVWALACEALRELGVPEADAMASMSIANAAAASRAFTVPARTTKLDDPVHRL